MQEKFKDKNKMLVITGTYPPEICGAGDYTFKLMQTSIAQDWELKYFKRWQLSTIFSKIKEINKSKIETINLQYPTMGYQGSFVPHLLCLYYSLFSKKNFTVTIHESSQLSFKAKLSTYIFFVFANRLIFTNKFELNIASKIVFWIKSKSKVIKIYSNIETSNVIYPIETRKYDLVYFGLIRPQKGLEEFILVTKLLKQKIININAILVGKVQPEYEEYANELIKDSQLSLTHIFFNKESNEVAEILSNSKIAYLPFPDGISERRGSALAVLKNGCLLITKRGEFTTETFEKICFFENQPNVVVLKIEDLLQETNTFFQKAQLLTNQVLNEQLPKSWDEVALEYKFFLSL